MKPNSSSAPVAMEADEQLANTQSVNVVTVHVKPTNKKIIKEKTRPTPMFNLQLICAESSSYGAQARLMG